MAIFEDEILRNSPGTEENEQGQEDAQETAAPEQEGEPQNAEAELLRKYGLDKFKTVEDALKAYKELEKKLGRDAEEKAALRRELEQIRQLLQPKEQAAEGPDAEKWIESFMERGPEAVVEIVERVLAERLAPIQQYLTQDWYQREAQRFMAAHPDAAEYREEMQRVLEEYPEIATHPKVYEIAYHIAKARRLEEKLPKVAEEAKEEGKKAALEKAAARLPGSATRRAEKEKSPEEVIRETVFGAAGQPKGVFD